LLALLPSTALPQQGETSYIADLEKELLQPGSAEDRVYTLSYLSNAYTNRDIKKALEYGFQSLNEAKALNDEELVHFAKFALANIYLSAGNYASSLKYYHELVSYYQKVQNDTFLADTYLNLGNLYLEQDSVDNRGRFYYQMALEVYEKLEDTAAIATIDNNLGSYYIDKGEYEKSLNYLVRSFEVNQRYEDSLGLAITLENLGEAYYYSGKVDLGKSYLIKSVKISEAIDDTQGLVSARIALAKTYVVENKGDSALKLGLESEALSKDFSSPNYLRQSYAILSDAHKLKGNYRKAFNYLTKYNNLTDSLLGEEKSRKLAQLEYDFALNEKNTENTVLRKNQALKEGEIQRQQLIVGAVLIVAFIVFAAAFVLYRAQNKQKIINNLLVEQNNQIAKQKEKLNKQTDELMRKNSQLQEVNIEKDDLMDVVAHDLKSPLNKIKGFLQLIPLVGQLNEEQDSYLGMANNEIEQGRNLISDLLDLNNLEHTDQPLEMEPLNLKELLQTIADSYKEETESKNISLTTELEPVFIKTNAKALERAVDNLLSNAIKFSSKGSGIRLRSEVAADKALIFVEDEGPGISPEDQTKMFKKFQRLSARPTAGESSNGLGLAIVKALVVKMQGEVSFESKLGEGTTFVVSLPLVPIIARTAKHAEKAK
jgi:signal transduction histidine kinase